MATRDYDHVQLSLNRGWVKISSKWLLHSFECNFTVCDGNCCKGHKEGPTASYHPGEVTKLPQELRQFLQEDGLTIMRTDNGDCTLIPYCKENKSIIPISCRLFPLGFTPDGRLGMKRLAWMGVRCPLYGKGNVPVYISMKDCLVDIFGEKLYQGIVGAVEYSKARRGILT